MENCLKSLCREVWTVTYVSRNRKNVCVVWFGCAFWKKTTEFSTNSPFTILQLCNHTIKLVVIVYKKVNLFLFSSELTKAVVEEPIKLFLYAHHRTHLCFPLLTLFQDNLKLETKPSETM